MLETVSDFLKREEEAIEGQKNNIENSKFSK